MLDSHTKLNCLDSLYSEFLVNPTIINSPINYKFPSISTIPISDALSNLLQGEKEKILNLFTIDTTNYTKNILKKFNKRLDDFIKKPEYKNFKFSKFKNRKNDKKIAFDILVENELTSGDFVEDGKKLKTPIVEVRNKINYYKVKLK